MEFEQSSANKELFSAFSAFASQLRALGLKEFPCGTGSWRVDDLRQFNKRNKVKQWKKAELHQKYSVTLRNFNPQLEMVDSLAELATSKHSPWTVDYDWSDEAQSLREMAITTPWLLDDDQFVWTHFRTLRLIDRRIVEIDENMLRLCNLESLTLTGNYLQRVDSRNLPRSLRLLELCANEMHDLSELCLSPPPLVHLGLGMNQLTSLGPSIQGHYWPELRSLDLSHNHLDNLEAVVTSLKTLNRLRNVVLAGNPLTLVPCYRGYVIDSLRHLDYLDDSVVSVDEKLGYEGIVAVSEGNMCEATIRFAVTFLKGLLPPEEITNADDLPEYPKIARRYFVQFMVVDDETRPFDDVPDVFLQSNSALPVQSTTAAAKPAAKSDKGRHKGASDVAVNATANPIGPAPKDCTPLGLPVIGVRTVTSEWSESVELNWAKTVHIGNLRRLRDFCHEGLAILVVEEVVHSFPAPPSDGETDDAAKSKGSLVDMKPHEAGGQKEKNKRKEKDDKAKTKQEAKGGKKKKDDHEAVELVQSAPMYNTLYRFDISLDKLLSADFTAIETTLVHGHPQPVKSPDIEDSEDKKEKEKDSKKDMKKKEVKAPGKDKKGKGKMKGQSSDDDDVIPPLELGIVFRLCHWKALADVNRHLDEL